MGHGVCVGLWGVGRMWGVSGVMGCGLDVGCGAWGMGCERGYGV